MAELTDLLAQGRHGEVIATANEALGRNPADEDAAQAMAIALACGARFGDVERIAHHVNRAMAPGRGWAVAALAFHHLLKSGRYDLLIDAPRVIEADSPLHILAVYHCACALMMQGDLDQAIGRFDWFRRHVRFYAAHIAFASHPLLSMIYRQGRLVAAPDEIDRRLEISATTIGLDHLGGLDGAAPGEAALFTCFDDGYFRLFGQRFADTNRHRNPTTPMILHVIGPSAETLAGLEAMARRWPGLFAASWEAEPSHRTVTYYASARFYVAGPLMERHGRPLISLDAELAAPVEATRLAGLCRASGADFACFGTGRDEPGSVWQASVMWFAARPPTHRFLATLAAYCRPELDHPSLLTWQLDQAALLGCRHYFQARGLPLAFHDLRQLLSMGLDELVSDLPGAVGKDDDKHRKMNAEADAAGKALGELYSRL